MEGVAVVGAGISGLLATQRLRARGISVTLLDQAPSPGGRLATRVIDDATVDHGAQFLTAREAPFVELMEAWRGEGCPIRVWAHGFARADTIDDLPGGALPAEDGHPRYVVGGGMATLAAHLAAEVPARCGHAATRAEPVAGGWRVHADTVSGPVTVDAEALLLTAPLPRSAALLEGGLDVAGIDGYDPCVALLAPLDRAPALPEPGGVQFAGGPVSWLADNAAKGISSQPALTVHASAEESVLLEGMSDDHVATRLWSLVEPWVAGAQPTTRLVERWPHAQPRGLHPQRCLRTEVRGRPLVLAGDAFAGPRVEGAALSGLAAAEALG